MRTFLIAMLLMFIPLFSNAQSFNPSKIRPRMPMEDEKPPQLVQLPTMKPITTLSHIEKAQAKLEREEQNLIKLARKAWDQEDDLKKEQERLNNLENKTEKSNDPEHQKNIANLKKLIAKSQDKVNKTKAEVESESKKVEDLEKAIEVAKYTRQGN